MSDGPPVPSGFVCPISDDIMRDPVMCADGHTYDRPNIEQWFAGGHDTSPNTGARLPHLNLVPNHALRNSIEEFLDSSFRKNRSRTILSRPPYRCRRVESCFRRDA